MRLPPPQPRRQREPIGPLVDVVFLLLIFFLLAGTLEPPQPIEVDPPEAKQSEPEDRGSLRILLAADGRIGFDGRVLDTKALAEVIRSGAGPDLPRTARVEADSQAAAGSVLALLKQLRALGLKELQLVTRPRRAGSGVDG
jgi:biopolymer transport protein ExbD